MELSKAIVYRTVVTTNQLLPAFRPILASVRYSYPADRRVARPSGGCIRSKIEKDSAGEKCPVVFSKIYTKDLDEAMETTNNNYSRGCGGIGRRAGFRCLWALSPWRFDSSHPHNLIRPSQMALGRSYHLSFIIYLTEIAPTGR